MKQTILFALVTSCMAIVPHKNMTINNYSGENIQYTIDGGINKNSCASLSIDTGNISVHETKEIDISDPKIKFLCVHVMKGKDSFIFKTAYDKRCSVDIIGPSDIKLRPECEKGLKE